MCGEVYILRKWTFDDGMNADTDSLSLLVVRNDRRKDCGSRILIMPV